jgi:hypothetical protein
VEIKPSLHLRRSNSSLLRFFSSRWGFVLAAIFLFAPLASGAEETPTFTHASTPPHAAPPSELFYEAYTAFGCFKFAGGETRALVFYAGVEYDRSTHGVHHNGLGHMLTAPGRFAGARVDYSADFIPAFVLREPVKTDKWGDPLSPFQRSLPGVEIAPLGFRWMWRDGTDFKPFWLVHLGMVGFTEKALSTTATYENFTINSSVGFQARTSPRTDLRLAYEFHHFSNAYMNGSNPGLDTLGLNFGIVYRLPVSSRW